MKFRLATVCLFALIAGVVLSSGCFSGGGGGAAGTRQPPPDLPALQRTLEGFFAAMSARNDGKAVDYFSQRAQVSGEASNRLQRLYVRDFGDDIYNPNDDASYTFTLNPDEVSWDGGRYVVPAKYTGVSGITMVITFYMVYEQGRYFIDEIGFDDGGASLSVNAPLAEYFPLRSGDKLLYAQQSGGELLTSAGALMTVGNPTSIDGRQVYPMTRSSVSYANIGSIFSDPGIPYSPNMPIGSMRYARGNVMADLFPGNETNPSGGSFRFALVEGNGLFYYGPNSSFNGGRPWKIIDDPLVTGKETVATVTFLYSGQTITALKTAKVGQLEIMNPLPLAQNGKAVVVPVEVSTTYPDPNNAYSRATGLAQEKHVMYLLKKVGIAGIDDICVVSGDVRFKQFLYKALVNGTTLANDLEVVVPGMLQAEAFTPFRYQFEAEGGMPPYTWTGTGFPPGMTLSRDGLLSGSPEITGSSLFEVVVKDALGGVATYSARISVLGDTYGIKDPGYLTGLINRPLAYEYRVVGGQSPFTWSILSVSDGSWTIAASTTDPRVGVLRGSTSRAGTVIVEVKVTDGRGEVATRSDRINIQETPTHYTIVGQPSIILPAAILGVPYSYTFTTENGPDPAMWSVIAGSLPEGLYLQSVASCGVISGTPTQLQNWSFDISVSDSIGYGAASCSIQVLDRLGYLATQTDARTVVVTFERDPNSAQAADPSRYLLVDETVNREDTSLIDRALIPAQSVVFNSSTKQARVTFADGAINPLRATQKVLVSNVRDVDETHLASGPEVILGGRLVFRDYLPWSSITPKGVPKKVYLPHPNDSRLFLLFDDLVQERSISISAESKMAIYTGPTWFGTLDTNAFTFYDLGIKYDQSGQLMELQGVTVGAPPFSGLYYHRQTTSNGPLASFPLGIDTWGPTPLTVITASFPTYGLTRDFMAMGTQVRLYGPGVTSPDPALLDSISFYGRAMAVDSGRTPMGSAVVFWIITDDRKFQAFLLEEGNPPNYDKLNYGPWHLLLSGPVGIDSTRYGLDWLEDSNEFLIADSDRNRIGRYAQPMSNDTVIFNQPLVPRWEIGHNDVDNDYLGSVNEPFFIKRYQGNEIVVADRGGISLFEEMP